MGGRRLLGGLAMLAFLLAVAQGAMAPSSPRPASIPPGEFSAERATGTLRTLLEASGPDEPRPLGSEANARFREAIVEELRSLGLEPSVRASLVCGRYLACGPVVNVVVRIRGTGPGRPVLLATHHDTVPAGPGVADDASGVAIALEIARALVAIPAASDVIVLLDDGEEQGLLGAEAFRRDPEAGEIGAVVNLEARGTAGPSLLFETTGGGAPVVRALAAWARHPVGSSLSPEVYRRLPNDTDLTVLRDLGVPAGNLAYIGGAVRYHTPLDDLGHLDPGSIQHQGENALALVRGLAAGDGGPAADLVWFDVLGLALVRFPEELALPLALLLLALGVAGGVGAVRRGGARAWKVGAGILLLPVAVGVAVGSALVALRWLGVDPRARPWIARTELLLVASIAAGLLGAAVPAAFARWLGASALRAGLRAALAAGGVALAAWAPGGSYLVLVPLLAGVAARVVALLRPGPGAEERGDLAVAGASGLVLLPIALLLYPSLGLVGLVGTAALIALAAVPLAPLASDLGGAARAALLFSPAAVAAAAAGLAPALPVADADSPERIIVCHHQDADSGRARVLAHADLDRLPAPMRAAAAFSPDAREPFGWGRIRRSFEAEVPPSPQGGPEVEVLERSRRGSERVWRARIRSPRGAPEIQLAIPPGAPVRSVRIDGVAVPAPAGKLRSWFGGWSLYRRLAVPPEGTEVEVALDAPGPVRAVVADSSPGLPPAADAVARARPSGVVTLQEGDTTLFTRGVAIDVD